jgi:hypothetical protein
LKFSPTPTTRADIARCIYRVAVDDGELQLRYRGRTIDVVLDDISKEPTWDDISLSVSDQRTSEEKNRSRKWTLPPLTKLERHTLKQRALSELHNRWKRNEKRKPHPDQLAFAL